MNQEFAHNPNLIKLESREVEEFEIELEKTFICPVDDVKKVVHELANRGLELVYVSDMYLPKRVIEDLLEQCGYGNLFKQGYVSSETGVLKRTGDMYKLLNDSLNKPITVHIGDNRQADLEEPANNGIASIHWIDRQVKNIRRRENVACRLAANDPRFQGFRIVYKLRMLKNRFQFAEEPLGTVLCLFAASARMQLCQSWDSAIFPARDGLLLRELVYSREDIFRLPPSKYAHLSRRNVMPLLHINEFLRYLELLLHEDPLMSWLDLAWLIGLDHRLALEIASLYGLSEATSPLNMEKDSNALTRICSSQEFQAFWQKLVTEKRENLRKFLDELATHAEAKSHFAFMDFGWNGSVQSNLASVLRECEYIHGFYFGLTKTAKSHGYEKSKYSAICASQDDDFFSQGIFQYPQVLEVPALAPHPPMSEIQMELDWERISNSALSDRNLDAKLSYQRNTLQIMKAMDLLQLVYWPSIEQIASVVRCLTTNLLISPTKQQAQTFGKMQSERGFTPTRYTLVNLDEMRFRRRVRTSIWKSGAIKSTGMGMINTIYTIKSFCRISQFASEYQVKPTRNSKSSVHVNNRGNNTQAGYRHLLEQSKKWEIPDESTRMWDLLKLRTVMSMVNMVRILRRHPPLRNQSLPTRSLILYRLVR